MAAKKKPSNKQPKPPIQGPPAPGEYRVEYMNAGKWQATLGGKSVPQRLAADVMSGRTVEAGTRSLLQGLRTWTRGGGGSILRGR
jgi:hypothetical protein